MIIVDSLTKKYGGFTAVDHVTFRAEPGRVTGFLGPNGAGKSTTMRILVGLTPASSGTSTVLGRRYADLPNPGREIGVLLDASAQHAGRTGREILTLAQRTMRVPGSRVDEMLDLVSLSDEESARRVRDYSLGMRQRLGIATALIGDPEVLVLDEPANGLDPAGIRWMRDLLRGFANQGGTVLLSSHLLHEIEVIADDLVVIGNGRIVAAGTKSDLLAAAGHVRQRHRPRGSGDGPHRRRPHRRAVAGRRPYGRRHRPGRPCGPGRRRTPDRAAPRRRGRPRGDVPRAHQGQRTRGSRGMTTATAVEQHQTVERSRAESRHAPIPFRTIVGVELRKAFDTRSGFWLMAAIAAAGVLATGAVLAFASDSDLTYDNFAAAIGVPMTILLPVVAILAVTGEWSQRAGLTTFTLVPHRGRVIRAKLVVTIAIGLASMALALSVGALGNIVGTGLKGVDTTWDLSFTSILYIVGADLIGMMVGFMLGIVTRNSAGAIVTYFSYWFVIPTLSMVLATNQSWFEKAQPWVDFNYDQGRLYDGGFSGQDWAQLAITGTFWLLLPLAFGLWRVMRAEVK